MCEENGKRKRIEKEVEIFHNSGKKKNISILRYELDNPQRNKSVRRGNIETRAGV